jgi:hypothetical protein
MQQLWILTYCKLSSKPGIQTTAVRTFPYAMYNFSKWTIADVVGWRLGYPFLHCLSTMTTSRHKGWMFGKCITVKGAASLLNLNAFVSRHCNSMCRQHYCVLSSGKSSSFNRDTVLVTLNTERAKNGGYTAFMLLLSAVIHYKDFGSYDALNADFAVGWADTAR